MPVYLARFGALGPVKIGCSRSVQRRLDGIQARLWDELKLLRLLDGSEADERALHRRFANLRIRNEWFVYSPEMMGDLGLPDLRNDPSRALATFCHWRPNEFQIVRAAALRAWMVERGLYEHDLASLLGCARSGVEEWLRYGHRPTERVAKKLIELSDGKLEPAFKNPDRLWQKMKAARVAESAA